MNGPFGGGELGLALARQLQVVTTEPAPGGVTHVLPFHKRNARLNEVEDLQTCDIEVVRSRTGAQPAARGFTGESPSRSSRSRRMAPPADDEVTRLMPAPSQHTLPPPPDAVSARTPVSFPRGRAVMEDGPTNRVAQRGMTPMNTGERNAFLNRTGEAASLRGGMHRTGGTGQHERAPEFMPFRTGEQSVRKSDAPPPVAYRTGEVPAYRSGEVAAVRSGEVPAMMRTGEVQAFGFTTDRRVVPQAPNSVPPMAMSVTFNTPTAADRRRAAATPGTVITTRTRVLSGKPAISWAAALVAMGIFTGLVTAVLARGEGDAVVDATAAFVDPARGASMNANGAAGQVAAAQPAAAPQAPAAPAAAPAADPMGPVEGSTMAAAVGFAKGQEKVAADKAATEKKVSEAVAAAVAAKTAPPPAASPAAPAPAAAPKPAVHAAAPRVVHVAAPKAEKVEHAAVAKVAASDEPAAEKPQKAAAADKSGGGDKDKDKEKKLAEAARKLADQQLEQSL